LGIAVPTERYQFVPVRHARRKQRGREAKTKGSGIFS
jgi:hypothetical protein